MLQGEFQGDCGVCRKPLTAQYPGLVICTKCRALYHPECWGFNGAQCGIYGCATLPRVRPAAVPPSPRPPCSYHLAITSTGSCIRCHKALCGACSWTSVRNTGPDAPRFCDDCVPRPSCGICGGEHGATKCGWLEVVFFLILAAAVLAAVTSGHW